MNFLISLRPKGVSSQVKYDAFVRWFEDAGGEHPNVSLSEFPGMGRGVVAMNDIPKSSTLLSVPLSITLCRDTILDHAASNISTEAHDMLAQVGKQASVYNK
jgi:hypothetical protein